MNSDADNIAKRSHKTGFFDAEFKDNKIRYVAQCVLATLCVLVTLMTLNTLSRGITIAALGASSFITFAMPHQRSSTARVMLGGYMVGIIAGTLCYMLSLLPVVSRTPILETHRSEVFGALAVGMAIFLMVITETEHPPAAGLALGFVTDGTDIRTVAIVCVGIAALYTLKTLLKPALIDLT